MLREYSSADLRRIANWGPDGLVLKDPQSLSEKDVAVISEVVPDGAAGTGGSSSTAIRSALDVIARHLGMFVHAAHRPERAPDAVAEDAREVLARRLARFATGGAEE